MTSDPNLSTDEHTQDVAEAEWSITTSGEEVVAHLVWSLSFAIARPAAEVWRRMKDFSSWQEDLQYSCVIGDQADGTAAYFTIKERHYAHYRKMYGFDPAAFKKVVIVRRAAPEKLIVLEALSEGEKKIESYYVLAVSEKDRRTTVTGVFAFAPLCAPRTNEESLREKYQAMGTEVAERWKATYIPRLRRIVECMQT